LNPWHGNCYIYRQYLDFIIKNVPRGTKKGGEMNEGNAIQVVGLSTDQVRNYLVLFGFNEQFIDSISPMARRVTLIREMEERGRDDG